MKRLWPAALGSLAFLGLTAVAAGRTNWPNASADKSATIADLIDCAQPNHHDGDALRCGYYGRSMRLYAIDAPEMPGACRPGRWRVPGDPYASRDHLASLTSGRHVTYRVLDHDRYGRAVVQVFADGVDLSCQMVRDGFAIERYGKLRC